MRNLVPLAALAIFPMYGWGPEGHRLVARIAWEQLTPATREKVAAILGPDQTMVSVATWADEVRHSRPETEPYHYIDVPIDQPHLDMARDCPKHNCIVAKIADYRKVLRDSSAPAADRREALQFVVHFIGDLHQPLHSSDHHDRGGNEVRVEYQGHRSNLHSVWDSGLISKMGTEDELYPELLRESERHERKWDKGTVEEWSDEAHRASQKIVYGKLPKAEGDAPVILGADYERLADALVRVQVEKAGARLAYVLNTDLR